MKFSMFARSLVLGLTFVAGTSFVLAPATAIAADDDKKSDSKTLTIGDAAPALKVEKFLKGDEIKEFKKGHVYVVEFWATWCGPCIRAFPHVSELQEKYKDQLTVVGVNIWERGYNEELNKKIAEFMDKHGENMRYTVAFDGGAKYMADNYMAAANINSIPHAFIVNQDGKIAWIGHPASMDDALDQIVNKKWDMKKAKAERQKLIDAEEAAGREMKSIEPQMKKASELWQSGKKDEAAAIMFEIAEKAPNAGKNAGATGFRYMITEGNDPKKAYAFADKMITSAYSDDAAMLNMIAWSIVDPEEKIKERNADVAIKAAKRAAEITENKDAAILDTLARAYFVKGDKAKAIETQEKAVSLAGEDMKADLQKSLEEFKK